MSVPPRAFPQVAKQLAASGLSRSSEGAWRRVIIEKPFGHDLASAKELDSVVSEVFDPSSVFRIDHYLGKETVQNLLALRFANAMYEPIWNANYVDHVRSRWPRTSASAAAPAITTASAPHATSSRTTCFSSWL